MSPSRQRAHLSTADLAARAAVEDADIQRWTELGLLDPTQGAFDGAAILRAKLLAFAARRGITAEAIADACTRDPGLLDRYVEIVGQPRGESLTLQDAAFEAGVSPELARRLRTAGGLPLDDLDDDDLAALRAVRVALDVGFPEDALLQLVRVMADALGRVADAEVRLFHFYFHDRLRAEGRDDVEIGKATDAASRSLMALLEPSIAYFHHKAWEASLREDMLGHFAEEVAPHERPLGHLAVAVLFVDLVSFTPLTEAMGDAAAADVVDRFSEMVRELAIDCEGRVVKQIGDEFMLVFPNADGAVHYALSLAERAAKESHFPTLRMGAHFGDALYREADYLGATVNTAARVAGQAGAAQLVVTAALRDALHDSSGVGMQHIGQRPLKGVLTPVDLYLIPLAGRRDDFVIDPVCGMTLDPAHVDFTAAWQGAEHAFCSAACHERFMADPGHYASKVRPERR